MPESVSVDQCESRLVHAIDRLIYVDRLLLELDANECSINHRLAVYIEAVFPGWNVDCEYNRREKDPKELDLPRDDVDWEDTEAKSIYPDIVVHIRGKPLLNLLVVEVKKSTSKRSPTHDFAKLHAYGTELGYACAVFLRLGTADEAGEYDLEWPKKEPFVA